MFVSRPRGLPGTFKEMRVVSSRLYKPRGVRTTAQARAMAAKATDRVWARAALPLAFERLLKRHLKGL